MFKKILFTATTVSMLAVGFQQSAEAADNSANTRDHRVKTIVRDHRVKKTVRDHRTVRKNEVVPIARKDCQLGYENLRRSGYDHVVIFDCSGVKYKYLAHKDHALFSARMHAYSGAMEINYVGHTH